MIYAITLFERETNIKQYLYISYFKCFIAMTSVELLTP